MKWIYCCFWVVIWKTLKETNSKSTSSFQLVWMTICAIYYGTGSMTTSFERCLDCHQGESMNPDLVDYLTGCKQDIWSSCDLRMPMLQHKQLKNSVVVHSDRKCVISTAIRSPQTWIPSLFMHGCFGYQFCDKDIPMKNSILRITTI